MDDADLGCSPYIQLFKAGQLILTTAPTVKAVGGATDDLPFCLSSDGSVTFVVESIIQGDILIRCRHLSQQGQRVSMFRAAFHTGYTPPKVMRLTKAQLDGACTDKRFGEDFFVDLVFEECEATTASKHLLRQTSTAATEDLSAQAKVAVLQTTAELSQNEAAARRARGTVASTECAKANAGVSATTYDTMLHRDSRFWDAIAARKKENMTKLAESSLRSGPTIGRRRNSNTMRSRRGSAEASDENGATTISPSISGSERSSNDSLPPRRTTAMDAFTIGGGDFDFGADFESQQPLQSSSTTQPAPPKKDDLMDALMALDDDDEEDIVFSHEEDDESPLSHQVEDNQASLSPPQPETLQSDPTSVPVSPSKTLENIPLKLPETVSKIETVSVNPESLSNVDSAEGPILVAESETETSISAVSLVIPPQPPQVAQQAPVSQEPVSSPPPPPPPASSLAPPKPTAPATPAVVFESPAPVPVSAGTMKKQDDDLGLEELDNEIDALMGNTAGGADFEFDDDDEDLEDLEAFLTQG